MTTFNVGIIGCGNIFPMHAYSLQKLGNIKIAGICDIQEERASARGQEFGCPWFTDYKELIDSGLVDTVHVCTPHFLHPEMTVYALEKGLNVMTEKPMAITLAGGERMMEAAKKSTGRLGVIFQNRLNPGSQLVKQALDAGKLGAVLGAKLEVTWKRDEDYYAADAWRGTLDQEGGGVIINQAIHTFDLARWLIGSRVARVEGTIHNYCHPSIEVEDEASGILYFENGVNLNFYATNNLTFDDEVCLCLHCEKGKVWLKGATAHILYDDGTQEVSTGEEPVDYGDQVKGYWGVSHLKQIAAFYDALEHNTYDMSADQGFETHKMIMALYEQARKQR